MRRLLLCAALVCAAAPALAQQGTPPVRSPEVHADRRVTFRLLAPKAGEVALTCECFEGRQAMQRDADGVWSVTVGPIAPEIYEYEFWLDGIQAIDPRNIAVKTNSRPTPPSSVLTVPGPAPAFYDLRPVPQGSVEIRHYPSKTVNGIRRVHIYTPPGYARISGTLPVLYLLHGADGDDASWDALGRVAQILDNLMAERTLSPLVVVMPFGYAHPPASGVAAAVQRGDFERDLVDDLIPFVEANYRVRTDRASRALVGLSMGGGQALTIGLKRTDLFSRVGGFSAAVPRSLEGSPLAELAADAKTLNDSLALLWIGCGTEDGLFAPNTSFSQYLTARGVKHSFRATDGAHTWIVWRTYLLEVAPQLFPQR